MAIWCGARWSGGAAGGRPGGGGGGRSGGLRRGGGRCTGGDGSRGGGRVLGGGRRAVLAGRRAGDRGDGRWCCAASSLRRRAGRPGTAASTCGRARRTGTCGGARAGGRSPARWPGAGVLVLRIGRRPCGSPTSRCARRSGRARVDGGQRGRLVDGGAVPLRGRLPALGAACAATAYLDPLSCSRRGCGAPGPSRLLPVRDGRAAGGQAVGVAPCRAMVTAASGDPLGVLGGAQFDAADGGVDHALKQHGGQPGLVVAELG